VTETLTTCTFCGCGCNFYLLAEGGEVTGVSPAVGHPVAQGSLCIKGWHAHEFVHSPDRLRTPLVRRGGQLVPASWDEALTMAAERLSTLRRDYGPDALAFFSSAKCTNEENFLMMKLARAVFGTNNVDHCARLCHASTVVGLVATFGSGAMTNSIAELEEADCILVTGSNTTEQHPQVAARILRAVRRGADLIVVDPRRIRLAAWARLHLRQRSGTDVAWINGMMHVILRDGLQDRDFIRRRCENAEALAETVRAYPPERVEAITGIPAADLERAAHLYARAPAAAIVYSMGITQHTTGTDNVRSLANLAMLTGNVGKASAGVNPLRGQNNVQGACDLGALPNVFSGYQKVTDPEVRARFAQAWGAADLPERPGLTVVEALQAAEAGRLKALYIMGENPMVSDPDIRHVRRGLERLDFLLVQDLFLTETAELADVVLPGASFAEKDGTFTNTERRVQRVRRAVPPVGEARPDWEILGLLAERLGYPGMRYESPAEVFDEIARLTPIYGGMSYPRLEPWGLQWPCPTPDHPGTPFLHKDRFARGLGRFCPAEYRPPAEEPDAEFPMILTTGRVYFHWHTGSMTRRTAVLDRECPEPFVEVSPEDAGALGIAAGAPVRVASRRGEVRLRARVTEAVPPGTLFIPFHFREAAANLLTNPVLDPEAKIPELKTCAARITPCP